MLTLREGFYDEMVDPSGAPRPHAAEVDTHAWVEALVPAGGEPPIKGVFRGARGAELSASVTMTRTDASPARA